MTVARIIGDIWVGYLVQNTVVDSLSIVDMGIGVCADSAFLIAGALPAAQLTDEYPPRGWLYVASMPVLQQAESTGVLQQGARFTFDIRGMRKIDKGILFMNLIQANIVVGGTMYIVGRIRSLCLT